MLNRCVAPADGCAVVFQSSAAVLTGNGAICRHERTPVDEALATRPDDMEMLNLIASFQHDSRHKTATLPDLAPDHGECPSDMQEEPGPQVDGS